MNALNRNIARNGSNSYVWTLLHNGRQVCPGCGRREFSPYVWSAGVKGHKEGETVHPLAGMCNNRSKCGYHVKPSDLKEYKHKDFARIPTVKPVEVQEIWIPEELARPYATFDLDPSTQEPYNLLKEPTPLQSALLEAAGRYQGRFGRVDVFRAWVRYCMLFVDGFDCFPRFDLNATKIYTAKMIRYERNGHRCKAEGQTNTTWLHSWLQWRRLLAPAPPHSEYNCSSLFGLHLVGAFPTARIVIVEAEKTAVALSAYFRNPSDVVFLATGGMSFLNERALRPLKGKTVFLLPDADAYKRKPEEAGSLQRWLDKMPLVKSLCPLSECLDPSMFGLSGKMDIADLIIDL